MNEFRTPIKVLNGICLSYEECDSLIPGSVPVGEEATEHMLFGESIFVPQLPLDPITPSSKAMYHVVDETQHSESAEQKPPQLALSLHCSRISRCSSAERYPPVRIGVTSICSIDLQSTSFPVPQSRGAFRSFSAEHSRCLHSDPTHPGFSAKANSSVQLTSCEEHSLSSGWRSSSVEHEPLDSADSRCFHSRASKTRFTRSVSPDDVRLSIFGELHPSTVRWWDHYSSSSVNRKAVFTLDSSLDGDFAARTRTGDSFDQGPGVEGKHLLLPGRSDFEDELVREVAHLELAEFVIGEMEALKAMTQTESLSANNTRLTNQLSNIICSAVFAGRNKTKITRNFGGQKPTHSSLGLLALLDPQNLRVLSTIRNTPVQNQTKDNGPSPFADLFGRIQQGLFVDPNEWNPKLNHPSSCLFSPSSSANEPKDAEHYEEDLAQSHVVTTLASNLLTSSLERVTTQPSDSPVRQFLKGLHQLLVVSCDADWAFHGSSGSARPNPIELAPARALIPSNSAVVLPLLNDSGGQRVDLVSLGPQGRCSISHDGISARRRCHSFSSVDHKASIAVRENAVGPDPSMDLPNVSVHRILRPDRCTQSLQFDSKSNCRMEQQLDSCSSSSSLPLDSLGPLDGYGSINAICTPLPYNLLINAPVLKSKRKMILLNQNNCCAGCGLFVETAYLKRMRFCEFFGQFFCCVCHTNTLMILPGTIVTAWDFRALPVSNIARDRLNQLYRQPLLRAADFNPRILQNQAALRNCFTLRKQGNLVLPFVQLCQSAQPLLTSLEALPPHWLSSPDLWSVADLCAVRDGQLDRELRRTLQPIVDHLSTCARCRAQGFVCEICHSGQILFPFGQVNTVSCSVCMACFHRSCLRNPKPENCPRCLRRAHRQIQRQQQHE